MKKSIIVMAATFALLTGAIRIGDEDSEAPAEEVPVKKEKSGNVYDDYKPFVIKKDFDEEPFIH